MVLVSPPVLFYQTLCNIQTVASKWLEGMVAQKPSFSVLFGAFQNFKIQQLCCFEDCNACIEYNTVILSLKCDGISG